jgi:hypothetical protein
VLNFGIPQGAAGSGGSSSSSAISPLPVYRVVNNYLYYPLQSSFVISSINATTPYAITLIPGTSSNTTAPYSALTWVPIGCTATKLSVYSLQSVAITVTLQTGTTSTMTDSALQCSASTGSSCSVSGSVNIPANSFVDYHITNTSTGSNPSPTAAGVWTSLVCQ